MPHACVGKACGEVCEGLLRLAKIIEGDINAEEETPSAVGGGDGRLKYVGSVVYGKGLGALEWMLDEERKKNHRGK